MYLPFTKKFPKMGSDKNIEVALVSEIRSFFFLLIALEVFQLTTKCTKVLYYINLQQFSKKEARNMKNT